MKVLKKVWIPADGWPAINGDDKPEMAIEEYAKKWRRDFFSVLATGRFVDNRIFVGRQDEWGSFETDIGILPCKSRLTDDDLPQTLEATYILINGQTKMVSVTGDEYRVVTSPFATDLKFGSVYHTDGDTEVFCRYLTTLGKRHLIFDGSIRWAKKLREVPDDLARKADVRLRLSVMEKELLHFLNRNPYVQIGDKRGLKAVTHYTKIDADSTNPWKYPGTAIFEVDGFLCNHHGDEVTPWGDGVLYGRRSISRLTTFDAVFDLVPHVNDRPMRREIIHGYHGATTIYYDLLDVTELIEAYWMKK